MDIKTNDLKIEKSYTHRLRFHPFHNHIELKGIKFWLSFGDVKRKPYFAPFHDFQGPIPIEYQRKIYHAFTGSCPLCGRLSEECVYFSKGRRRITFLKTLFQREHDEDKLRKLIRN